MKRISVGILAHVDSGKTTLSEALLYSSGSINKLGRVDHGTSFLDNYELERKRGITIFSKQAVLKYDDTEITLVDTPGHIDFSAETERTLQVLDYAVLVISGTEGVQSHTSTLWKLLKKYNIPCFLFVNKMDLTDKDNNTVLGSLKFNLSDNIVDFTNDSSDTFFENIALCSDDLFEEYNENYTVGSNTITEEISKRGVFPCVFGSALKFEGIDTLVNILCKYTKMPDYPSEFGAKVYKISQDEQNAPLTFMKITGGSLQVRQILKTKNSPEGEKVNQIRIYSGNKYTQTESADAGTICAVTGITGARSGEGLGIENDSSLPVLSPVLTYRIIPPQGVDSHKLLDKLRILEHQDPMLNVLWNDTLGEIQIQLMGEIQLEVLKALIKDKFGISVAFGQGNIIYKETIASTVEGVGHFEPLRHYAEVHLRLKPGKKDSGIIINSICSEDVLNRNWQRLILTNISERTHKGVLTGSPVSDIEITLLTGKAHLKHTEGGDFRQAVYRAVRHGLRKAESVLLEPVYEFTLEVPSENTGRAMSDIQKMYGSFEPPVIKGDISVLTGKAPVYCMRNYHSEVLKYTKGKGRLMCILNGYEPCHNSDEVIENIGYDPDSDIENTADSVFCSHGAGFTVNWQETEKYMHLDYVLKENGDEVAEDNIESEYKSRPQASDKELMQIFERTYGAVKPKNTAVSAKKYQSENFEKYKRPGKSGFDGNDYLLVDGYNVIFSWEELKSLARADISSARDRLIDILCNYQGYKGCRLILVFDAYKVKGGKGETERIGGITIVYTKEAETADTYIEKAAYKLAKNNRVRVVTSDGMEQLIILGSGALRVPSQTFLSEVRTAEASIMTILSENKEKRNLK